MPNQQVFPNSTYPLAGDVGSTPGDPSVVVQGFQNVPVVPDKPTDGQVYVYVASLNAWVPADPVVSGPNAPGTPPTANPIQVGGVDDGGLVRELSTDTGGAIQLSMTDRTILLNMLHELRAVKAVILNLDNTAKDSDYSPDNFNDLKAGT
jgi:hypothetical protein